MNKKVVAFLDSGIGGLTVLDKFVKKFPNQIYIYLGDNDNAPYGNKPIKELKQITEKNVSMIKKYRPDVLVLACNTLTVNLLEYVREISGLETYGVKPRIPSGNEKTLLLCTLNTAKIYVNFERENFKVLPLFNLVNKLENKGIVLSQSAIDDEIESSVNLFYGKDKKKFYDYIEGLNTVILGCTHYGFVKIGIENHFAPQKVIDGAEDTVLEYSKKYYNQKSLVNYSRNSVIFIGKNAEKNKGIWERHFIFI